MKVDSAVLFALQFLSWQALQSPRNHWGGWNRGSDPTGFAMAGISDGRLPSALSESIQCGPSGAQVTDHRPESQRGRGVQQDFANPEYGHYPEVVLV